MKKNNVLKVASIATGVVLTAGIAFAVVNSDIKATLARDIKVRFEGQVQTMKDASGNVVYPIVYNGTTYLPLRAVSTILNVPANWEGESKTVVLGTEQQQPKSVLSLSGKASSRGRKVIDRSALTVETDLGGSKTYNDGIMYHVWNADYSSSTDRAYQVNIGNKYTKLSFDAYVKPSEEKYIGKTYKVVLYNVDTDEKIGEFDIVAGQVKTYEDIDIKGIKNIGFAAEGWGGSGDQGYVYMFNPTVE